MTSDMLDRASAGSSGLKEALELKAAAHAPLHNIHLPRFTLEDANRAHDEWGANCGPAALAVVAGLTLDQVRPHLGDFERKHYTNPTLMFDSLNRLGIIWMPRKPGRSTLAFADGFHSWPRFGLVRVQWEGPWTAPGVPIRVRYRHTHWVAAMTIAGGVGVFDVNCLNSGGWVSLDNWTKSLVPWLLKECEPKANGKWHLTHVIEVQRVAGEYGADSSTTALSEAPSGPLQQDPPEGQ